MLNALQENELVGSSTTDSTFNLFAILATISKDVYLIDASTLHFVTASSSGLKHLNRSIKDLQSLTVEDVFYQHSNVSLKQKIAKLRQLTTTVEPIMSAKHQHDDHNSELKMVYVKNLNKEVLIAIHDNSHSSPQNISRYQEIIADIPSLVFQAQLNPDQSLAFKYLNEGCKPLLGIEPQTLLESPSHLLDIIVPKDRASFLKSMQTSAKNQLVWNWEGGIWIEAWQDVKLVNLRANVRVNSVGDLQWSGVITNISQSKKEKFELDEMTSRFQAIVSNIPSLVFQCYLNHQNELTFNYLSDGCQALLGVDAEVIFNKPNTLFDLILPKDRASFLQSMKASAENLEVWNWEGGLWIEEWRDVKLVNLRATAQVNTHGHIQWGGVITNITQSKKEKLELDEMTSRFQAIVSNIPSLVFQCHLNQNNFLTFNYLSDGCRALLGLETDELLADSMLLFNLVLPKDRDSFIKSMQESAKELVVWNWEGGLWIEKWQDVKLVNLRATARINALGTVQWGGVITNITQSQNEKREIEESHKQLAELSSHMALVKEQERLRIAREIHDDLGGNLTAIKMGLASLINALPKDQTELIQKTKQLEHIVDKTFDDAHRITSDLRPNVLELGIVAALEWQSKEFEKQIGIPCDFHTNNENIEITTDQAIVLFRICQEATSNIAKHANANLVEISLMSEPNSITLEIHDDGVGIVPANKLKKNAFGLRGMAERVSAVGGEFAIKSAKDKGTTICVKLNL